MARPVGAAGKREHVAAVRLSNHEAAYLDTVRGSLSRSEYLRWLVQQDRKARSQS